MIEKNYCIHPIEVIQDNDLKELQENGGEYFVFPLNPEEIRKTRARYDS